MDKVQSSSLDELKRILDIIPSIGDKLISTIFDASGRFIIAPDFSSLLPTYSTIVSFDEADIRIHDIILPPLGQHDNSAQFKSNLYPAKCSSFNAVIRISILYKENKQVSDLSYLQEGIPCQIGIRYAGNGNYLMFIHPMIYFMERAKGRLTEDMMAVLGEDDEILMFCDRFNVNLMARISDNKLHMQQLTTSPNWPKLLKREKICLEYFKTLLEAPQNKWSELINFSFINSNEWVEDIGSTWDFKNNFMTVIESAHNGFITYINPVEQIKNDIKIRIDADLSCFKTLGFTFHVNIYRASTDTGTPDFEGYNVGIKRSSPNSMDGQFYLKRKHIIIQEIGFSLDNILLKEKGPSLSTITIEKTGGAFTLFIRGLKIGTLIDVTPLVMPQCMYIGFLASPGTSFGHICIFSRKSLFEPNKIPPEIEDLTFYKYPGHTFESRIGNLMPSVLSKIRYVYMKDVTHSRSLMDKLNTYLQVIEDELNTAKRIQAVLANIPLPHYKEIRFAYYYRPSKHVGGDLLDIKDLGQGRFALLIYDVSGHGIAASLISAMAKMSFENAFKQTLSPATIMELVNRDICIVADASMFLTAFLCIIDIRKSTLTYTRAGHCPAAIFSLEREGAPYILAEGNPLIGNRTDFEYTEYNIPIRKGDRLFMYTDGLVELRNDKDEMFGKSRLFQILSSTLNLNIDIVKAKVLSDAGGFANGREFEDDITFTIVDILSTVQDRENP